MILPWQNPAFFFISLSIDAIAVFTALFYLASAFLAPKIFTPRKSPKAHALSPVTLLKPLKGFEAELYENLRSFCLLDYPKIQILWTVADPEDPAIAVVERLQKEFPGLDMELVLSKGVRLGLNPKVNNLAAAESLIKHDFILISDSDVHVKNDFLRRMALPFEDPKIGLVTSFYRGALRKPLWPRLEALSINAYFLPQAALASFFGMRFAMGAAILVKKDAFDKAGGFSYLAQYLADDFILGEAVRKAGFEIEASDALPECVTEAPDFKSYLRHQTRWAHTIRACRPAGYLGLIALQGFSLLSLKILFWGADPVSLSWMALIILSKALAQERLSQAAQTPGDILAIFLLPLSEWVHFASWILGWRAKRPVSWRGEDYDFSREPEMSFASLRNK